MGHYGTNWDGHEMGRGRNGTLGHEMGRARNGSARNGPARNGPARNGGDPPKILRAEFKLKPRLVPPLLCSGGGKGGRHPKKV